MDPRTCRNPTELDRIIQYVRDQFPTASLEWRVSLVHGQGWGIIGVPGVDVVCENDADAWRAALKRCK